MRRLLRGLASDRGDADPLMTIYSVGISAILTTVVAGALSVVVLVASGFVSTSITRSDEAQARQLWATSLGNASSVSVLGSNKVIAYSYPDSRPGTYTTTAQDQTCVKTTWATSSGQLTATVERWSNSSCDRANGGAAATSKVTAVALDGVSDVAIGATNVGGRDLHFTTDGAEVGTTSTGATASTNAYPGDGGVSDAEWNSTAPRTMTLTGKVTSLAGASSLTWQATTSLRPSITTASVDEGLYFTPMNPVRFNLGTVGTTPVVTTMAGVNGIPTNAVAVAMNVETGSPSTNLYAHVTPAGTDYDIAQVWAKSGNANSQYATVKLAGGQVQTMVNTGTASMYLDVSGYYSKDSAASTYFPKQPTRAATASLTTAYKAVTLSGVPANATAVAVNVQVVNPSATGYIRVMPNGATDAGVAQQYVSPSTDTSNLMTMGVTNGALQAKLNTGTATAYFDVVGYYAKDPAGSTYVPVDFTRRTWSGALSTTKAQVQVANAAGVPSNASAVLANLYLTTITNTGYVRVNSGTDDTTLYPQRPVVASQNMSTPVQALLTDGQINIKASAGTLQGYFDVSGFFQPAS